MAACASKEVTTKQIKSISFGFYTDAEVRKLGVIQVWNPTSFDGLKKPNKNGLYDPAMGPLDQYDRCGTCKLSHAQCPGHFGYIELPLPVYNPLVFSSLQKLLRTVCLHCFHFKLAKAEVDSFLHRLQRLADGDLVHALAVQMGKGMGKDMKTFMAASGGDGTRGSKRDADGVSLAGHDDDGEAGGEADAYMQAMAEALRAGKQVDMDMLGGGKHGHDHVHGEGCGAAAKAGHARAPMTSHTLEAMQDTITAFYRRTPTMRCQNCGAFAPTIRKYLKTRLFMIWGSQGPLVKNKLNGTVITNPLEQAAGQTAAGMEAAMVESMTDAAASRAANTRVHAKGEAKGTKPAGPAAAGPKPDAGAEDEDEDMPDVKHGVVKADADDVKDQDMGAAPAAPQPEEEVLDMSSTYMNPARVEETLRRLWSHEWPLLHLLFAAELAPAGAPLAALGGADPAASHAYSMFFLRCLPVSPNRFRPPTRLGENSFDNPMNVNLGKILTATIELLHPTVRPLNTAYEVQSTADRQMIQWLLIQDLVSLVLDATVADKPGDAVGIRQTLEKKEGLFRKNMMGKRVNFAARSVISPDPEIGTGEIGVPPYFAMRLSFPERVTPFNVERLRAAVLLGASVHPGAVAVENENGTLINLGSLNYAKREAIAKQLLTTSGHVAVSKKALGGEGKVAAKGTGSLAAAAARQQTDSDANPGGKIVYRHLVDGDLMLTNRQPTLHKPGLMAHRARVLAGERTIRMHYANCATFNADFDGDEINLHLPQDQYGRAEATVVVLSDEQYIVPTDGKPIRGLIQDHVVGGTLLCKRDTFLSKKEYNQLVFKATGAWGGQQQHGEAMHMEPPTLFKPRMLWTGKQVVSTVMRFWTQGLPPLTVSHAGKTPAEYWGRNSGEDTLTFFRGTLVTGVVDKAAFAKFGLVHAVQELYGNTVAGKLLSSFSRLFTMYVQGHGLTCGLDDLLLVGACERGRQDILDRAEAIAINASAKFVNAPGLGPQVLAAPRDHQREMIQTNIQVCNGLSARYRSDDKTGVQHDGIATSVMHPLSSEVVKLCLPAGQVKAFPKNCLSTMTVTGAKGGLVNFSQITCLLGQQELEGRRVPRMASGKTLPCFRAFDSGARSGGFVGDRFLTGLRPQEYYFHCMAGREGLVDTTVKTSRSGYLQRCVIKNLESLRVHHDNTVRDNCDGSVVQFYYGEDGLDIMHTNYMRQFKFLAQNTERFSQQLDAGAAIEAGKFAGISAGEADVQRRLSARAKLLDALPTASSDAARRKIEKRLATAMPVMSVLPPAHLGSTSEAFSDALAKYVATNPDGVLKSADGSSPRNPAWPSRHTVDPQEFTALMQLNFMRALVAPGEAVGVIAGQSIGEPSTQMTLNTFHMAGRGEANVTLGIPRLRELLMTASANIKTPVMNVPIRAERSLEDAHAMSARLRPLHMGAALRSILVESGTSHGRASYTVTLAFHREEDYPEEENLTFAEIARAFHKNFCPKLKAVIELEIRRTGTGIGKVELASLGGDEANVGAGVDGAAEKAPKSAKGEAPEDHDDDDELKDAKLRYRGGRDEAATYDAPDEDEAADAATIAKQSAARARSDDASDGDDEEEPAEGATPSKAGARSDGGEEGEDDNEAGAPSTSGRDTPGTGAPKTKAQLKKEAAEAKRKAKAGKKPAARKPAAKVELADDSVAIDQAAGTCCVMVVLPAGCRQLMMSEIVDRVAASSVIRATDKVERVYVLKGERGEATRLQMDGINFPAVWEMSDVADVNRLTTNDVHSMLRTYGVEAARATVMHEVQAVFQAYGIGVDPRHLSLIADFMTQQGGYRACNRLSIERSVSPFLKMSFETAAHFLTDATLHGSVDDMRSPSSRIVAGRIVDMGTGVVELVQQLPDISQGTMFDGPVKENVWGGVAGKAAAAAAAVAGQHPAPRRDKSRSRLSQ